MTSDLMLYCKRCGRNFMNYERNAAAEYCLDCIDKVHR